MKALFSFLPALLLAFPVHAGEGHDHGDAPATATGTASPRLSAHSDLFELVGIVDKGQMTVYLDRYSTNEPVINARIEFEAGAEKGVATAQADGTYLVKTAALTTHAAVPFAFTVTAGSDTDLLATELDLKEAAHAEAPHAHSWKEYAGYAAAALVAIAVAVFALRKFRRRSTPTLA